MNTCPKCGATLAEGMAFCSACGERLATPEAGVRVSAAMLERVNQVMSDLQSEREQMFERLDRLEQAEPGSEDIEKVERMVQTVMAEQSLALASADRRIEYAVEDQECVRVADLIMGDTNNEQIREVQRLNDQSYLVRVITGNATQASKVYKDRFKPKFDALCRAMAVANTGYGAEYVPTGWSNRMIELVQKRLNVSRLFDRFQMPTNPYIFPVAGADPVAYKITEQTDDTSQTKIPVSSPGTANTTMTAVGMGARTLLSKDLEEDSIIPIIPRVEKGMSRAFAKAQEQACISGDTSTTHMDSNVTAATDARKLWTGLRKDVPLSSRVDMSTFNAETVLALINELDPEYAEALEDLVYLTSIAVAVKMLMLRDSKDNLLVTTNNELANNATIVRGYLGQLFSMPIVSSGYIGQNLNATGVYDGTTTTKTIMMLLYPDAYLFGDRRQYTAQILRELYSESDQVCLLGTQRLAFKRMQPSTVALSAMGINITTL